MKLKKIHYSFASIMMILIALLGFTLRQTGKKNFYLPLGITGIFLIIDKDLKRRNNRKNILNKIKFYKERK